MTDIAETMKIAAQHFRDECLQQAEEQYQLVLQSQPDNATALHMLGAIAHQKGDNRLAVDLISKAITVNSQIPQFHNNIAVALKALGKFEEAVQSCKKAIELKPDFADAYYNMGNSLASLGRYADAAEQYSRVLLLKPDDAYTYYNMGVAMQELGRHADAVENFKRTIQLNHNAAEVYRVMSTSQQILGQHTDAINTLREALCLEPDCPKTRTVLGMALLKTGNFTEGWREYRWRLEQCSWKESVPDMLRWDGSNFTGKRLLLRCEQGYGDNIQFIRYLPMVKARGGTVILGMYAELYDLLKDFSGADETVNLSVENQPLVFDLYSPLMDLPGVFNTTLETIPAQVPYIFADPVKVKYWRNKISTHGFKVGIVWAGSTGKGAKQFRDCKLADFAPLSQIDDVQLYALQKGGTEQIEQSAEKFSVVNLAEEFQDFSDTAAAIENLDLVISVDTSVLHLAGAMGKPVLALLSLAGEWRWLLDRLDSPWYPTMRLFRQKELNRWDDVFGDIAEQIVKLVPNKSTEVDDLKINRLCKDKVPAIIPAYKNKSQLEKCKAHLEKQTVPVEIFIRDNNQDNIYFTAAINEGLKRYLDSDYKYIMILNQDMYLEPNAVEEMVKFMDSHPRCGIGSPLQLSSKIPNYVVHAGCLDAFPDGRHQHGQLFEFTKDEPVFWVNGACMILRKEMIQEIGLFDNNYILVGSDSDYCFTARSRGWQVWRIAVARGTHEGGISGEIVEAEFEMLKMDDTIYFTKKWVTGQLYKELSYERKYYTLEND